MTLRQKKSFRAKSGDLSVNCMVPLRSAQNINPMIDRLRTMRYLRNIVVFTFSLSMPELKKDYDSGARRMTIGQ